MLNKITVSSIIDKKSKKEKIVCLTAYSYNIAKIIDPYVDIILVGDSVGMVVYGMDNTLSVTLDMIINHTKAVVKATKNSLVIADMPFASVSTPEITFANASRLIGETGASGVKIEGGKNLADNIRFLSDRGVAVMGHIGLMPQHVEKIGGYKVRGKEQNYYDTLLSDAKAIEQAGAFAIVIEATKKDLVDKLVNEISIPLIGIGASDKCDGQILVSDDIFGTSNHIPKFAKIFSNININEELEIAVKEYSIAVRNNKFPENSNCF